MQKREKVEEIVKKLNVIDDTLFQKMAEDIGFCEELISTILEQNVVVKEVIPQNSLKILQGRSVILDALCTLAEGEECNVEVQKADDDNHVKRVRYNASCITANVTEPGVRFEHVKDVVVIYISKFDMFQEGKTIYHIDRVIRETGKMCDNGLREIYVNAKVDDGTDIAELMRIFRESNVYDFEKFPRVSQRKKQFKEAEGGEQGMCELVENYAKEYAEEATRNMVKEMVKKKMARGKSVEAIVDELELDMSLIRELMQEIEVEQSQVV